MKISCLIFAAALATFTLCADVVKIEIPPEKNTFKPGPGADLAQANCIICHSVEYVTTQPPMPRKFWEASVKKMREKYGAPVTEDIVPKLVDYLTATYGTPVVAAK